MARKKKNTRDQVLPMLKLMKESEEAKNVVKSMLTFTSTQETWRGVIALPPGSVLEKTIEVFRKNTDIPLEIPFFVSLHFLSAYLLQNNITIDFKGEKLEPDLWSVILAESGTGKSFASRMIKNGISNNQDISMFPHCASAAKFVDELQYYNRSFWLKDEFAQFLKALENQTHMEELKDILLKLYDNDTIERRTKKYNIKIDDPALTILGMTVYSTFFNNISNESMLDGFAQRFSYIIAKKDNTRNMEDFPLYPVDIIKKEIADSWNELLNVKLHDKYEVNANAIEAFKLSFGLLSSHKDKIDDSFFRRIMWRGVKYALLYHIILKKNSNMLDEFDMGWAGRVCWLHMQDMKEILSIKGCGELEALVRRAEAVRERIKLKENREITARDLVINIKNIKNVNEAKSILSLL